MHTHLVHADVYGALASPHADRLHEAQPRSVPSGPWRHAERALAHRARRIIAISEAVRRFSLTTWGCLRTRSTSSTTGSTRYPSRGRPTRRSQIEDGAPVLLCVARLAPQKGVDVAVRALPQVPGAMLVVLGEGPDRASLEALAQELGVADRVLMPGRVGDVAALYLRCDVLVHPARWEGFGLALLEAMLAGKPVAAVDAGAAPELVLNGITGLLSPPDDAAKLAENVRTLLAGAAQGERYGELGRARAEKEFSVERMTTRTLEVYERAASASR